MLNFSNGMIAVFILFSPYSVKGQQGTEGKKVASSIEGILIPASATMTTAWDIPRDPLADSSLNGSPLGEEVRRGYRIFTNTQGEAPGITGNPVSCGNCHLNAGQREKALPLVGVAGVFPEYNKRAGRLFSLEDRIVGCFLRSENSGGSPEKMLDSKEVRALSSYIEWLGDGYARGSALPWRGQNVIEKANLLPLDRLDKKRGEKLFVLNCSNCHGTDGQGVQIGDKKAGPLWGPASWNDGAGASRIYTLAGFIRHAMPYLSPGSLTDEEAQHVSFFINSQHRPSFMHKADDYRTEPLPPDAVYYQGTNASRGE